MTEPLLLTAKPVVSLIRQETRTRAQEFMHRHGRKPKLLVVLVGNDPASVIYTKKKGASALDAGLDHETVHLPETSSAAGVKQKIESFNKDNSIDGILIQRPLPSSFSESDAIYWVTPEKDVDAFHPLLVGKLALDLPCLQPCTPSGIMDLLRFYNIDPAGKLACVVGRSQLVGKPLAGLLLKANATVVQCHSKTKNIKSITRQADILVAAIGKPGFFDASYIKQGATVIDVGMHRSDPGKLCGDVVFEEVSKIAGAITPVPGGVGPMTVEILLRNTVTAAEQRA